ncbi:hypothetical protein E2C01_020996 [Portunus trituberculatus]|uniref:Uncharacterized protein n=1 Tax=Portunus trituberculatus TaxID=210409 RepID=A0A5B7E1D3_PORTR|nr:hypothetical protein [Portunus trituberculatus]
MSDFYGHIVSLQKFVLLLTPHRFDFITTPLIFAIADTTQLSHEFTRYSFHDIAVHTTQHEHISCSSQHTSASYTTQEPVFTELECGVAHGLRPPARLPRRSSPPTGLAQSTSLPACLAGWLPEPRRLAE